MVVGVPWHATASMVVHMVVATVATALLMAVATAPHTVFHTMLVDRYMKCGLRSMMDGCAHFVVFLWH